MGYSITLRHTLKKGEPLDEWEMSLPDEWFKPKFGFDGSDIGPFGKNVKGRPQRTLFWVPKNVTITFELHKLIMSKRRLKSMRGVIHTMDYRE